MEDKNPIGLPENAYRELKPGETYEPILSSTSNPPEPNLHIRPKAAAYVDCYRKRHQTHTWEKNG